MHPAFVIAIAYFLGSIPFGYILVRLMEGSDIRESGSGGTGATNVSRKLGKKAAIPVLILDAAKGAAAVMLCKHFGYGASEWILGATLLAAVAGHVFPIWLKFRGGKGVATGLGTCLVVSPLAALVMALIFLTIVLVTRYISLGSIVASLSYPLWIWIFNFGSTEQAHPLVLEAGFASWLIVYAHRENLHRLSQGTENRFK